MPIVDLRPGLRRGLGASGGGIRGRPMSAAIGAGEAGLSSGGRTLSASNAAASTPPPFKTPAHRIRIPVTEG
jgi:hypothetical protein